MELSKNKLQKSQNLELKLKGLNMTLKEFKELIAKAEKKGEINENQEVFVLNEDEGVMIMSEPVLFTDSNRNLILKYSYQNEVLNQ